MWRSISTYFYVNMGVQQSLPHYFLTLIFTGLLIGTLVNYHCGIYWHYLGHWPCFYWWCSNPHQVSRDYYFRSPEPKPYQSCLESGSLLDEPVQSVNDFGRDIELLVSFTYLGSTVQNNGGLPQKVLQGIFLGHVIIHLLSTSMSSYWSLWRRTKIWIFMSFGLVLDLPIGCETWT